MLKPVEDLTDEEANQYHHDKALWLHGGLAAFELVVIVQLLTLEHIDLALKSAVYCFATSFPISLLLLTITKAGRIKYEPKLWFTLAGLSGFGGAIGLVLLFIHFSPYAGIVFFLASFSSLFLSRFFWKS